MSGIKFSVSTSPSKKHEATAIGVLQSAGNPRLIGSDLLTGETLRKLGVTGKLGAVHRTIDTDGEVLLLVGLGGEQSSLHDYREAGGSLGRLSTDLANIVVNIPTDDREKLLAFIEGIALGAYEYPKTAKTRAKLSAVTVVTSHKIPKSELHEIGVLASATQTVRNLSATPANLLYPEIFAKKAIQAADENQVKVQVWDEKQLAKDGFGAILAVGAGSARPPRLVKLVYAPKGAKKHLAIVGKGITFDTGGLAVKPLTGMLGMKYDMTGAAVAFQTVIAAAQLGIPLKVTAWLCLAENMISGSATKPGDVIKARNGKTIEVTNPDAEGRLVMADGLSAASEEQPDLIVDVATLTGAARIALGTRYAGLIGTPIGVSSVETAAQTSGELVWEMPLPAELKANLESEVADLAHMRVGAPAGGMLVAAHFLSEFVGLANDGTKLEWAHLDIAGPADNEGSAYGFTPKGPTGVMVRTLVRLAQQMSAK